MGGILKEACSTAGKLWAINTMLSANTGRRGEICPTSKAPYQDCKALGFGILSQSINHKTKACIYPFGKQLSGPFSYENQGAMFGHDSYTFRHFLENSELCGKLHYPFAYKTLSQQLSRKTKPK